MASDPGPLFRVCSAPGDLERLRAWRDRAAALGIGQQFLDVVRFINERLTADPLGWGDPLYHYHHAGLLVCRGVYQFLHVHYAVDDARRIVYVRSWRVRPGHLLAEGS
jgi:hypothetical protein